MTFYKAQQVGIAIMSDLNLGGIGLNLRWGASSPDSGHLCFSSVFPGECLNSTFK
jgi:hypothetical protein